MTSYDPRRYQAVVLKAALKLYRDTGMKANRAYTPKNMMATASKITGETFKPRDYSGAIAALAKWIDDKTPPWE